LLFSYLYPPNILGHRGRGEHFDQILASVEFFSVGDDDRRRLPEVESRVNVAGELPSVEENSAEREEDVAPDHAPVTATFDL
jgi:hypothetical protein